MRSEIVGLVESFGLLTVFLYSIADSALLIPFLPGDVIFTSITSFLLIEDVTDWITIAIILSIGSITGNIIVYWLARSYGRDGILFLIDRLGLNRSRFISLERWFNRWGSSVVFWSRFIPLIRSYISIPAGITKMRFFDYLIYTVMAVTLYMFSLTYLLWQGKKIGSTLSIFQVTSSDLVVVDLSVFFVSLILIGLYVRFRSHWRPMGNP